MGKSPPPTDEIRWNLKLRRALYEQLQSKSSESGVAMADIARLALVQFFAGLDGKPLSLEHVRTQLAQVELQLEETKK